MSQSLVFSLATVSSNFVNVKTKETERRLCVPSRGGSHDCLISWVIVEFKNQPNDVLRILDRILQHDLVLELVLPMCNKPFEAVK